MYIDENIAKRLRLKDLEKDMEELRNDIKNTRNHHLKFIYADVLNAYKKEYDNIMRTLPKDKPSLSKEQERQLVSKLERLQEVRRDLRGVNSAIEQEGDMPSIHHDSFILKRKQLIAERNVLLENIAAIKGATSIKTNPYSTKAKFCHERIASPKAFDPKSFRTKTSGKHKLTVGCKKGHYKQGRCDVPMSLQKVMHPVGEGGCKIGGTLIGKHSTNRNCMHKNPKLVDFGYYGQLYIIYDDGFTNYYVTDIPPSEWKKYGDKFNVPGWTIRKSYKVSKRKIKTNPKEKLYHYIGITPDGKEEVVKLEDKWTEASLKSRFGKVYMKMYGPYSEKRLMEVLK